MFAFVLQCMPLFVFCRRFAIIPFESLGKVVIVAVAQYLADLRLRGITGEQLLGPLHAAFQQMVFEIVSGLLLEKLAHMGGGTIPLL